MSIRNTAIVTLIGLLGPLTGCEKNAELATYPRTPVAPTYHASGQLVVDGGCTYLAGSQTYFIVWPHGTEISRGKPALITLPEGATAQEGHRISLVGGEITKDAYIAFQANPASTAHCTGPYFLAHHLKD